MQPVLVEILAGFLSTKKWVRRCGWTPEVPQKGFESSFILMTFLQGMRGLDDFFSFHPCVTDKTPSTPDEYFNGGIPFLPVSV